MRCIYKPAYQEVCLESVRDAVAVDRGPIEVWMKRAPMAFPPVPISLKRMSPMDVRAVIPDDEEGRDPQG